MFERENESLIQVSQITVKHPKSHPKGEDKQLLCLKDLSLRQYGIKLSNDLFQAFSKTFVETHILRKTN